MLTESCVPRTTFSGLEGLQCCDFSHKFSGFHVPRLLCTQGSMVHVLSFGRTVLYFTQVFTGSDVPSVVYSHVLGTKSSHCAA